MSSFGTGGAQPLDGQGNPDIHMPVRAVNRSDEEIVWVYDRQRYRLPPGVAVHVPYLAMCLYQGDPRAIDKPGGKLHEQYRRQVREHLRTFHGVYENDERWDQIPLVECYPIDSDIRFETVLLDPDGVALSGERADQSELEFLRSSLAAQQHQLAHLQAQIQMREDTQAAVDAAGLDHADLDSQVTTSKAAAPEHSMVGAGPVVKKSAAGVQRKMPAKVTQDS